MVRPQDGPAPILTAVSNGARQLSVLLKCLGFAPKAQVRILPEGLRFTVEEARVMQGVAFLDRALFTSYIYHAAEPDPAETQIGSGNGPEEDDDAADDDHPVSFQISLPALLETLQIFGLDAPRDRWSRDPNGGYHAGVSSFASGGTSAFDRRVLGMSGVCRLSYAAPGAPFSVILEETGVTTTCELVTYEPDARDEIPLQRERLALKIIMRAAWLHDAILELAATNPTRLTVAASPTGPQYLALSAAGPLGSATVEFSKDPQLLETFQVARRTVHTYKFALIKNATRAMSVGSKVSIRGDEEGVLSLQFMIEFDGGGVSFVDYRFMPFLPDEGEDPGQSEEELE